MTGEREHSRDTFPSGSKEIQLFLDGLVDAAVLMDVGLRPIRWNRQYVAVCGLKPRLLRSKAKDPRVRCSDLLRLGIGEEESLAQKAMSLGRPLRMDEIPGGPPHSLSGEKRLFIVSAIPLLESDGDPLGAIEIYREVTAEASVQERYKLLLERERSRSESLEEIVQARTADLERSLEELQQTRDQLVQSEKLSSLGTLVAGLAHELNNPINFVYGNVSFLREYMETLQSVIKGYGELPLDEVAESRIKRLKADLDYDYVSADLPKVLAAISNGIKRSAGIVQSLRTFIHPSGDTPTEVIDVSELARSTVDLVSSEYRQRITFRCESEDNVPTIRGSEGRINQVLMNLVMNAVQAIPEQGVIAIETRTEVRGEKEGVVVTIQDDGAGISPEDLLRIFEPFFTTKPVGKGTGLGLSISYSIVQNHGGELTVESELGHGTAFALWLPLQCGSNTAPHVG